MKREIGDDGDHQHVWRWWVRWLLGGGGTRRERRKNIEEEEKKKV